MADDECGSKDSGNVQVLHFEFSKRTLSENKIVYVYLLILATEIAFLVDGVNEWVKI